VAGGIRRRLCREAGTLWGTLYETSDGKLIL
jgi:hypothetical protein